ncbi:G5 domain-containing protein [Agromyces binzhouensis]|uniref:DUF2510 domain-containing protein n=1 Tax=Agromyces binzhouensis TaxID=1817495 RepID=A0A4Q2JWN4_9MICO|nr:G5 domain-containing protein [Agromyces binzhouensis]RXZ51646.1 DUF2510 domain-containing protein [Agromyces binzhouensis]
MPNNAPAGWYDDGSGRQRWWDGSAWTDRFGDELTPSPPKSVSKASTWRALPTAKRWLVVGGFLILLVVGTSGGWGALFAFIGFAALIVGVIGLARGSFEFIGIRTRPIAAAVVAGALVVMMVGAGITGSSASKVSAESDASHSLVSPTITPRATASPTPTPVRVVKQEKETEAIPFGSSSVDDSNLDVGLTELRTPGADGERTVTYEVVIVDGVQISRTKLRETVTKQPVDEVTAVGTKVPPPPPQPAPEPEPAAPSGCDPNYEWACVPIASDVDCAGGSGNGPEYVWGPVHVIGSDIYDLDRDGDGVGCD